MIFIPIRTDSPLRNTPWMNWLLIAVNVGVFLLDRSRPHGLSGWALSAQRPEIFQFITYQFMHADVMHIAGNLLFLYIFGNAICDRIGSWAFLAFYLAGGVFAGIGYCAFTGLGTVQGASGSVAAVTGAFLALLPRSRVTIFYWIVILFGLYEIPSLWLIGAFFAKDLLYSFSRESQVAHLAHVSGSIFGFMVALLLLKSRLLARDHFDMLSLIDRWNRRRQYQAVVAEGYDPFNYAPSPVPGALAKPAAAPRILDQVQDLRAQASEALAHGQLDQATAFYLQLRQLDANQTLSRSAQVDVANHLYGQGDYLNAAAAYELYLKSYRDSEQAGQVRLMLGLAYGRYLNQPEKAKENLVEAVRLLQFQREFEMAKAELARLGGAPT